MAIAGQLIEMPSTEDAMAFKNLHVDAFAHESGTITTNSHICLRAYCNIVENRSIILWQFGW